MTFGQLSEAGNAWRLRFTRRLDHAPDKVWQAITQPEHLEHWFPTTIDGERKRGAPLEFRFRQNEGPTLEGEVLEYDPPRVFEVRWAEDVLRFELAPDGDGTLLTFSDTIGEMGRAARDGAGWHECLDLLAYELGGRKGDSPQGKVWGRVHPTYVETFGPEAATMGPPNQDGIS